VLAGGRRVTVAKDFVKGNAPVTTPAARFLRAVVTRARQERLFGALLTPDYDLRHANHLHLDGKRWGFRWWWQGAV
jgi:hypothetical protein